MTVMEGLIVSLIRVVDIKKRQVLVLSSVLQSKTIGGSREGQGAVPPPPIVTKVAFYCACVRVKKLHDTHTKHKTVR
jgi:hypothetical protein